MTAPTPAGLDERQLEQLYHRLERPLYNVAYRWLWDSQESADVVQEAFVRLWKMRRQVRPDTVEPLVFRIAVNLCRNRRRSRKLWRWVPFAQAAPPDPSAQAPEAQLLGAEQAALLRRAVEQLPEALRAVVLLCELSELSYHDVALALRIPPGTVASRRHHAIRRLRQLLDDPEVPHDA